MRYPATNATVSPIRQDKAYGPVEGSSGAVPAPRPGEKPELYAAAFILGLTALAVFTGRLQVKLGKS